MANEAELKTRYQMAMTYLGLDDVRNMKKAQTMIMELAAEEDYAPAQEKLAEWYAKGYLFPRDEEQAEFWHKKASGQATPEPEAKQEEGKDSEEMFDLALDMFCNPENHQHQDGTPCTQDDAVKIFEALAQDNYAPAQVALGDIYISGTPEGVDNNAPSYHAAPDEKKAVQYYKSAANQKDPAGLGRLGMLYLFGDEYKNEQQAVYYLQQAADLNDAMAQVLLGLCYETGSGVEQDTIEAIKWYKRSAENGSHMGQEKLGECYYYGDGVPKDYQKAIKLFRKAAEPVRDNWSAEAQNMLGVCYADGHGVEQDTIEAVKWYKKAAENGSAWGQYNLADSYDDIKDYTNAVKWYHEAAEQGLGAAQNRLGIYYANGQGVKQSYYEAVKWYKKAAENGYAWGQYNLAERYFCGEGVTQNYDQATKWYRKAAEQNIANAQNRLGVCYANGKGVTKNQAEAVSWFKKAAENGDAWGQYNLGGCYDFGDGIPQDYKKAVEWYRKAAEQGIAEAQNGLGVCYENGKGVAKNQAEAVKWYRKAAENGDAWGQYNLANCYYRGAGVKQNRDESKKWLKKAADQGNEDAAAALKDLNSSCFITTAVCGSFAKPDDCYELTAFRRFRDRWLAKQPDGEALIEEYYRIAPSIVKAIDQQQDRKAIYKNIWTTYLQPCLTLIETGKQEACKELYVKMVRDLQHTYLNTSKGKKFS